MISAPRLRATCSLATLLASAAFATAVLTGAALTGAALTGTARAAEPAAAAVETTAQPASGGGEATAPDDPSAPETPPVVLSGPALEAASAFRAYEKQAALISPAFTSGASVEQSLAVGSAYEPKQLSRGEIAYAALIALQDPTFVSAVRIYAKDPGQRRDLAARIEQDPRYAVAFDGSANAAGLIVATMASEAGRIQTAGAAVKQSAYTVQHSAWSKSKIIDPAGRLAQTKARSAAIMASVPEDVTLLRASEGVGEDANAAQALGVHGQPIAGPYEPVVTRGLAVAALAVLGAGGDDNDAAVETVMTAPENGACLNLSKLNLYQCLAVAGPWYEDVFCLGEHALKETAQCLVKETATPGQIQTAVTPAAGPAGIGPQGANAGATATAAPLAAAPSATLATALVAAH